MPDILQTLRLASDMFRSMCCCIGNQSHMVPARVWWSRVWCCKWYARHTLHQDPGHGFQHKWRCKDYNQLQSYQRHESIRDKISRGAALGGLPGGMQPVCS